jgi:hypothetical protein
MTILINNSKVVFGARPSVQFDPDAQAFIDAAVITDTTQKAAINQLVLDLKSANIWTKMLAVYPFVGGSATSHKWNLKNPLDTNAAFRLVFSGGWTHNSLGIKMNNSNTEAETYVTSNNGNNRSISAYLTERLPGTVHVVMVAYNS